MSDAFDVIIIGAGPAGMSAAIRLSALGLSACIIDEQPAPGGQIWRDIERKTSQGRASALGSDYADGAALAAEFRQCGATYLPETTVWQVEAGFRVFIKRPGDVSILNARTLLIATGAMERPVPFPGWTLPGVMTIGAAQILLKTAGQIPDTPVWVAGSGPLLLLYINQLLDAGGKVAGILSTEPPGAKLKGLAHIGGVLGAWGDFTKGLRWNSRIRSLNVIDHVTEISATGNGTLESVRWLTASGATGSAPASLLLVHEGVVPDVHLTQALGCRHAWNDTQQCFVPVLDEWGATSFPGVFVAGDGGGIGGAKAACAAGEVVAHGIAKSLDKLSAEQARGASIEARSRHAQAMAIRPMLDAMYPPRAQGAAPLDDTIVCRCESVTAGAIRAAIDAGAHDPNHIKAQTRCGMGPCLGRQCGAVATQILAKAIGKPVAAVGLSRVRPPLRPITLAELASLAKG